MTSASTRPSPDKASGLFSDNEPESNRLVIYKASAGSGKTWRLSLEYLKRLIKPDAGSPHRHILAVTFTNKATAEMKDRILHDLFQLAQNDTSSGTEAIRVALCKELFQHDDEKIRRQIQQRATTALTLILHDYSHFLVETIDSFFQTVLRHLARELHLGAAYDVELDEDMVLEKAVDRMIEQSDQEPEVFKLIKEYIEDKLDNGEDRRIDKTLKEFGKNIFREFFQEKENELNQTLTDPAFIKQYQQALNDIHTQCLEEVTGRAQRFFDIIEANGLCVEDFSYGKSGVAGYFIKLRKGDFSPDNFNGNRIQAALEDPEKWAASKSPNKKEISRLAQERLIPLLKTCENSREANEKNFYSSGLAVKHLYKVGLLTAIARHVREINNEDNRFLLSDTAHFLKTLIGDSDSPFIFEKIGTDLQHTMIDEFQDTSHLQWQNFKPLLKEGLANGKGSLMVGDEKQSIYRFRNGDWRILNGLKEEMAQEHIEAVQHNLPANYRSEAAIVRFNNDLFEKIIELAADSLVDDIGPKGGEQLRSAYGYDSIDKKYHYKQSCSKKSEKGLVEAFFLEKTDRRSEDILSAEDSSESYEQQTLNRLIAKVEELQRNGIQAHEIAILVRKNKNIPQIAAHFSNYKAAHPESPYSYNIISDEAFQLQASVSVKMIVAALKMIADSNYYITAKTQTPFHAAEHNIAAEEIRLLYRLYGKLPANFSEKLFELAQLPLAEMTERLYQLLRLDKIPQQEPYLFAFMDAFNDFTHTTSSDINDFLEYWDDKLCTRAIPGESRLDGIRALSIHKSKGLQYHTVLVPFCDWTLSTEVSQQIWCTVDEAPYNKLPLIPVDFVKDLKHSIFAPAYREESLQMLIDNINLLYVAFTRAEKNLFIYSKIPSQNAKVSHINDLLYQLLSREKDFDEEGQTYAQGSLCTEHKKQEETKVEAIRLAYLSTRNKAGFRQSNRSRDFIRDKEDPENGPADMNSYIERGKLLHRIFSLIRHPEDAENAVRTVVGEGELAEKEATEVLAFVREALHHPQAKEWYTGEYELFNECVILFRDPDGLIQEKRPDRVVQRDEKLQVIDFKFGKKMPKYRQQVNEYMQLLQEMGHRQVEGYLWYVTEGEIETVNPKP